jgi:small neutral amino acid transporter SnatA (MarC family)
MAFGACLSILLYPVDIILLSIQHLLPSDYILACGRVMGIFPAVEAVYFSTQTLHSTDGGCLGLGAEQFTVFYPAWTVGDGFAPLAVVAADIRSVLCVVVGEVLLDEVVEKDGRIFASIHAGKKYLTFPQALPDIAAPAPLTVVMLTEWVVI